MSNQYKPIKYTEINLMTLWIAGQQHQLILFPHIYETNHVCSEKQSFNYFAFFFFFSSEKKPQPCFSWQLPSQWRGSTFLHLGASLLLCYLHPSKKRTAISSLTTQFLWRNKPIQTKPRSLTRPDLWHMAQRPALQQQGGSTCWKERWEPLLFTAALPSGDGRWLWNNHACKSCFMLHCLFIDRQVESQHEQRQDRVCRQHITAAHAGSSPTPSYGGFTYNKLKYRKQEKQHIYIWSLEAILRPSSRAEPYQWPCSQWPWEIRMWIYILFSLFSNKISPNLNK